MANQVVYDLEALCNLINRALEPWRRQHPKARCKFTSSNHRNKNTELAMPAVWRDGDNPDSVCISRTGLWYDFPRQTGGTLRQLFQRLGYDNEEAVSQLPAIGVLSDADVWQEDADKRAYAQHVWYDALPLTEAAQVRRDLAGVVRDYLASRGLLTMRGWQMVKQQCRVAENDECPGGAILMVPLYDPTPPYRRISGMQRIYLTAAGEKMQTPGPAGEPRKAKRMLGLHKLEEARYSGLLIPADPDRLSRDCVTLGIVEGYETGLGLHLGTGFAVLCMLDTNGLENVCIDYVRQLKPARIVICGDNDDRKPDGRKPGWDAAKVLSARLLAAGVSHELAFPPRRVNGQLLGNAKGADWLDAWRQYDMALPQVVERSIRFYRQHQQQP